MKIKTELSNLKDQDKEIVVGKIRVKNIYVENNCFVIELDENNTPQEYEIVLINTQEKSTYEIINYIYEVAKVKIPLESLPEFNEFSKGIWSFAIKSIYNQYMLLEEISLGFETESPQIIKDLKTFITNDERILSGVYLDNKGSLLYGKLPSLLYKKTTRNSVKNDIRVHDIYLNENCLTFLLEEYNLSGANIEMKLKSRKTKEIITLHLINDDNIIKCEFEEDFFENLPYGRWDASIEILRSDMLIYGRLNIGHLGINEKEIKYFEPSDNESILFYQTISNNLSLVKGKSFNVFREKNQILAELTNLKKTSGKKFYFSIVLDSPEPLNVIEAALKLRNEESHQIITVDNIKVKLTKGNLYRVTGYLNITWEKFSPLYWDILLKVSDYTNRESYIRVNNASKKVIAQIDKNYFKNAVYTKHKIIYPYVTFNNNIAFIMREKEDYETFKNGIKKTFAFYVYKVLKQIYFDRKNIWLAFEKFSKTAQDNGYAFFSYVDKNDLHKDFYYILDKESPDYKRVKEESKNIIPFMSFKYMLLLYGAKLLISSETRRHAYNIRIRSDRIAHALDKKKSVFLQHGVTGLKQSDVFKKTKGRGNFDLVVATSDMEKEIIKDNWYYKENEIIITGFSRWDLLDDKSTKVSKNKIFVMPTWRAWMEGISKEDFQQTQYYLNYVSFLNSKELHQILNTNDIEVTFFLHPKFKEYVSEFNIENENIKVKEFLDIKVNEELMESSLLISDYSSVTWDMFYMNKPVIFFQFDHPKYEKYEGSYLNMNKDLFGDRVVSVNELIVTIKDYVQNDFSVKPKYMKMLNEYFKYNDQENSRRIYEEINNRIK